MGEAVDLRVLFWNTWLLQPRIWPGGPPLPGADRLFAPDVGARAPLVGEAIAGRFDVAALAECFEPQEQQAVCRAWRAPQVALGPSRRFPRWTGSGLITVVDPTLDAGVRLETSVPHRYRSGGDLRDSDTFATKGALLTRLRSGAAEGCGLDLVSTHLFAGGDLLAVPGSDDHLRHHDVRMRQVGELVEFIERERDPSLPLLLMGDFNIRFHDTREGFADPGASYRDLADRLAALGLRDLWLDLGDGPGHTCTFGEPSELPPADDEPDAVRDEPGPEPSTGTSERIDHAWIGAPVDGSPAPTATSVTRWAFPGRAVTGGPAGSLSDHLGLSVELALPTLQP